MKVQHVFSWPVVGYQYHKLNVVADDGTTASVIVPNPTGKITVAQAINIASQQGPALLLAKQRDAVIAKSIEAMTKPVAAASVDQQDYDKYITDLKATLAATATVKPAIAVPVVEGVVK